MTATINTPTPMPLLNIASCLCELTTSPNDLCHIPHYLLTLLPLSHVSFAIVRHLDTERVELVVSASASSDQCALPPEAFRAAALNRALRDAGLSEGSWKHPGNAPTPSADDNHNFNAHASAPLTTITQLNATHRMVLIAYLNGDPSHPASDLHGTLDGARNFLARSLAIMFSWTLNHAVLGEPFLTLNKREWQILLQLSCDDSEKELAERLQVSPHTLHSLIKGVYKKLQVPGRLVALNRLRHAVREYRLQRLGMFHL